MRNDLVARLGVYTLQLPSLQERKEDVAPLFMHFVRDPQTGRSPAVDAELIEWLCLQPWVQNVRQLEWLARAMVALHDDVPTLTTAHLPPQHQLITEPVPAPSLRSPGTRTITGEQRVVAPEDDSELYGRLLRALDENGGVVLRAAESLGITRQKAYRILEKQGIELDQLRRRR
jgi:DNA-binding NtrC family response regulator